MWRTFYFGNFEDTLSTQKIRNTHQAEFEPQQSVENILLGLTLFFFTINSLPIKKSFNNMAITVQALGANF